MDYSVIIEDMIDCFKKGQSMTACDASKKYGCSVSSIRKYIAKIKESDSVEDINLYNEYLAVSNFNKLKGTILGGENGKKRSNLSLATVSDLCEYMIENDCTLRQMEKEFGIPKSTLYENLSKLKDSRLQEVYDNHHRNALNSYDNDTEDSFNFHSVGSEISSRGTKLRK